MAAQRLTARSSIQRAVGDDLYRSQVMRGQAVIAGTRVAVSVVLDCLAAGMTAEEIAGEYPTVTIGGVRAAADP